MVVVRVVETAAREATRLLEEAAAAWARHELDVVEAEKNATGEQKEDLQKWLAAQMLSTGGWPGAGAWAAAGARGAEDLTDVDAQAKELVLAVYERERPRAEAALEAVWQGEPLRVPPRATEKAMRRMALGGDGGGEDGGSASASGADEQMREAGEEEAEDGRAGKRLATPRTGDGGGMAEGAEGVDAAAAEVDAAAATPAHGAATEMDTAEVNLT